MAKILLVEPDKVLGDTYKAALTKAGHEVFVCPSAQMAIQHVDKKPPEVIITELQLAEHNGVEFLYELRSYEDWQAIPVIVLSSVPPAESGLSDDNQAKLNVHAYCYKPSTTLTQLTEVVEEATG